MICKKKGCYRQSKTRIGYCTDCAGKYENKRQEYFDDLYYDKEVLK